MAASFGTDGIRGRFGTDLTRAFARELGRAAGAVLDGEAAIIGRDTRASGPALRDALAAGFADAGVTPIDIGIAPTPAVAHIAAERGAIGAVLSASHNPAHDNGIKLFTSAGDKLLDVEQQTIESELRLDADAEPDRSVDPPPSLTTDLTALGSWARAVGSSVGGVIERDAAVAPLSVVIDAANGAASHVVGPIIAGLDVEVSVIHDGPDGDNINHRCGSTHPEALAEAVVSAGADLGIALDGDADRLVAVDHTGQLIDGDHLMAILAVDLRSRHALADDTLVVTVMSNLGLHRAMERAGISTVVTAVGDRWILEALRANEWSFGGEQSGHLIFADIARTGDGVLSAVQLLDVLSRSDLPLAELADQAMTSFPQVLRNVRVAERAERVVERLEAPIQAAEQALGADGRVLVRASGTEPVIRVMVEAADADDAKTHCDALCAAVEATFS